MVEALHKLMGTILREHSPQEVPAFDSIGLELLEDRLKKNRKSDITESTFAPDLESGLLMLHLLGGTLSLIEIYRSSRRMREEAKHQEELQRLWEECLVKRGVPPHLAHLIAFRNGADLTLILESNEQERPK